MKTDVAISVTEWLVELARLSDRSDDGLTSEEWAEHMGVSVKTTLIRLAAANRAGWLRSGRRVIVRLDGVKSRAPVYRIVKPTAGSTVTKRSKP